MSPEYRLRWNNHRPNLVDNFKDFLHHESLVDVTLAIGGQFIHAHKVILAACSIYFKVRTNCSLLNIQFFLTVYSKVRASFSIYLLLQLIFYHCKISQVKGRVLNDFDHGIYEVSLKIFSEEVYFFYYTIVFLIFVLQVRN